MNMSLFEISCNDKYFICDIHRYIIYFDMLIENKYDYQIILY